MGLPWRYKDRDSNRFVNEQFFTSIAGDVGIGQALFLNEVDGEERAMTFLTNNLEWSPRSVAELYRCRWQIEVFFKQIKQSLHLADFLGHNANAVRWQGWTALLVCVLLRYLSHLSQ
jgi:IS4 transposase